MLKTHLIAITGNMFRNLFQFYTEMDYVLSYFLRRLTEKKSLLIEIYEKGVLLINQRKEAYHEE